jgi:hypothetical protein
MYFLKDSYNTYCTKKIENEEKHTKKRIISIGKNLFQFIVPLYVGTLLEKSLYSCMSVLEITGVLLLHSIVGGLCPKRGTQ